MRSRSKRSFLIRPISGHVRPPLVVTSRIRGTHIHRITDLLLPNILERLADTVVWDLALAYEQRPTNARVLGEDDPEHLAQYRKLLEDAVASLPPFEADPPLPPEPDVDAEAAEEYVGRKRVASVEIPRCVPLLLLRGVCN